MRGLVRFESGGAEMWAQPDLPDRPFNQPGATQDIAVDEAAGIIWVAMTIPDDADEASIGGATFRDCDRPLGVGTSLLVRVDAASGTILDVTLPADGLMISSIALADGGLVLTGGTHTDGDLERPLPSVELCGSTVTPEMGETVEMLIATIE